MNLKKIIKEEIGWRIDNFLEDTLIGTAISFVLIFGAPYTTYKSIEYLNSIPLPEKKLKQSKKSNE